MMADSIGTGYPPGGYPGGGFGGSYGPGYGMSLTDRLKSSVGRNITVYVGDESTPVMGMLHSIGDDFVEVHRMNNNANEAMLIPLGDIMAISVPM